MEYPLSTRLSFHWKLVEKPPLLDRQFKEKFTQTIPFTMDCINPIIRLSTIESIDWLLILWGFAQNPGQSQRSNRIPKGARIPCVHCISHTSKVGVLMLTETVMFYAVLTLLLTFKIPHRDKIQDIQNFPLSIIS